MNRFFELRPLHCASSESLVISICTGDLFDVAFSDRQMVRDESQPAATVAGRVVWDEQNLADNERIKATIVTGKINEPKTPWQELMPDDGIDVPGGPGNAPNNCQHKESMLPIHSEVFPDSADLSHACHAWAACLPRPNPLAPLLPLFLPCLDLSLDGDPSPVERAPDVAASSAGASSTLHP